MNKFLMFVALIVGCQSSEKRDNEQAIIAKPAEKSPEERNAEVVDWIKFAATLGDTCSAGTVYKKIIDEYPESKSVSFAKKSIARIEKKEIKEAPYATKHLQKLDAETLDQFIHVHEAAAESCKEFEAIAKARADNIAKMKAFRLSKYGY